jgi:hypothetical protein
MIREFWMRWAMGDVTRTIMPTFLGGGVVLENMASRFYYYIVRLAIMGTLVRAFLYPPYLTLGTFIYALCLVLMAACMHHHHHQERMAQT